MKNNLKILLLTIIFVFTFKSFLFSQNDQELKNKIRGLSDSLLILDIRTKNLTNKINTLSTENKNDYFRNKGRIEKLNNSVESNIKEINIILEDVAKNKREIGDLRILIYEIEVDYKKLVEKLDEIEIWLKETNNEIELLKQNQTAIYEDIAIIHDKQRDMGARLNKVPDLYFCRDCIPKFAIGVGSSFFPTNIEDIPNSYAWSIDARYKINENINIISEVNFPNVLIRTVPPMNGENFIVDKWDISIYSLGANFNFIDFYKHRIKISGSSSIFYANGKLDNFYNQSEYNTQEQITQNKFGLLLDLELSYNDYINKNPLEFYVSLNSYISNKNILLTNSIGQQSDIGLFLPSIKTGIRFCFY